MVAIHENEAVTPIKPKSFLGVRHAQVVMLLASMMLCYMMRVDMSMAIVAMTDPNNEHFIDWSVQTQSMILSSFFWGYVVLMLPSGELAKRFGGKIFILLCVSVTAVMSLCMPFAILYGGWPWACACRVIQGVTQGFLFPALHHLIGKWVPVEEKSRLGTLIYSGAQLGTSTQLIVSGFIADSLGWPAIFFVNAVLGAIWTGFYLYFGADSPQVCRLISDEERFYIQSSLGQVEEPKKLQTPWKKMFTSLPCLALLVTHVGQDWGFWSIMTQMPSYMNHVLGVNITTNGVLSSLPYIAMYLLSFVFGFMSDFILKKNWISTTACRKLSNSIGEFGPALALFGLTFAPAGNVAVAVLLLTITVGLNAGHYTGFLLVHLDMTPNFAASLMSITNFAANFACIFAPLVAGVILSDETNVNAWMTFFYTTSGVYIVSNTVYLLLGTSERQSWDDPSLQQLKSEEAEKQEKA